jgi:hypothetical protein
LQSSLQNLPIARDGLAIWHGHVVLSFGAYRMLHLCSNVSGAYNSTMAGVF